MVKGVALSLLLPNSLLYLRNFLSSFYLNITLQEVTSKITSLSVFFDLSVIAYTSYFFKKESFRVISIAWLPNASLRFHLQPIYVIIFNVPHGILILKLASRLDAFSAYPCRT